MSAPRFANELPEPELTELEQLPDSTVYPSVPVHISNGPVQTQELPSRAGVVLDYSLGTAFQLVIGEDAKRKRCLMVADGDFFITHAQTGNNRQGGYWPAKTVLEWCNTSAAYARAAAGTVNFTVIPEEWSD